MDSETSGQPNKALIAIIVIVLLVAVTAAVIVLGKQGNPTQTVSTTTPAGTTSTRTSSVSSSSTGSYKDGTYKESGTYRSPGGSETINLSVTLSGGLITATDMTAIPSTSEARDYQGRFIDAYKALVVGKKIGDVSLDRVAGSSLTSGGFNNALDQIKSDAQG